MEKLPDYGPLEIENFASFLEKSREEFNKLIETPTEQSGCISDFKIQRLIGSGAFGDVFLFQNNNSCLHYAIKVISKEKTLIKSAIKNTRSEKILLHSMNFPFIVRLDCYFMDNSYVYFVMPFISRGNVFDHLRRKSRFNENLVRFYGSQVVLGLEYLHYIDVVYRDLKPENIVIDHTGYVKITDFGFAKIIKDRTYTICGTPEYIAPEMILNESGYGKAVDWWSLGILLYEMASGYVPFYHRNTIRMYGLAASLAYIMPNHFSSELKHLVKNILQTDLSRRFGNLKRGVNDIKDHQWFRPIVWSSVLNRKMKPPFIPEEISCVKLKEDVTLKVSIENRYEKEFQDF